MYSSDESQQMKLSNGNPIPFQSIIEDNEAGLFYLENDRIVYANPAFVEVLGSTVTSIIGTSIINKAKGEDREILRNAIDEIKKGHSNRFSKDLSLNRNDEENVYFSIHLKVVNRRDGIVEMAGASRDATSRVTKSIKLSIEKSRFASLYENDIAGIFIYNYEIDKIIDCNQKALDFFGYPKKEQFLSKDRFQFVPQSSEYFPKMDLHKLTDKHAERVKKGEAFNVPGIFQGYEDRKFFVRANVIPTFHEYGEAFIIFNDITKSIEADINNKAIEKRYKVIFENSHEGIIYLEANRFEPILSNENALELMGLNDIKEFDNILPHDFIADRELLNTDIKKEDYFPMKVAEAFEKGRTEFEMWARRVNGEIIRINVVFIAENSDKNRPKIIAFIRDITHLYEAQDKLNQKNKELKKYIDSNLELENFAYLASHDLQTPLRSMISFTQLLERRIGESIDDEAREYLDFIIQSGHSMRNLVNDLLSYSRVNTNKINLEKINLKKLLFQINSEMSSLIREKDAYVNIEMVPDSIVADRTKIKQVFQNLIGNAIKFSKEGTSPEVLVTGEETDEWWQFSVKDNGIGIPDEFKEKIFLLFKRLHGVTDYEGTGIGLALVKKIVEQHEGEIKVNSEPGKGSEFVFLIRKPF